MSSALPPIGANNYEAFVEASQPRAIARINASILCPIYDLEVDLNAHGATSSGSVTLPINGNPDFSQIFGGASSSGTAASAEIFVGWPSAPTPGAPLSINGLKRAYYGLIAQYDPKFAENLVTFELRSLASPLVDEKIQFMPQGLKTTEFVGNVCSQFGLKFVSKLPSNPKTVQQVLAAEYDGAGSNFAATVASMKIWDLILQCAQFDNVDVWEDEGTVYYASPALIERQTVDLKYGRDLALEDGLTGSHSLMFAKDIQVEVRTFQQRKSQSTAVRVVTNGDGSISVTAVSKTTIGNPQWGTPNIVTQTYYPNGQTTTTRTSGGGLYSTRTSLGTESTKQIYKYVLHNRSPEYANAFAVTQWRKKSQQEYTIQLRLPLTKAKGLIPLSALLRLHSVPYQRFNSTYYPSKILLTAGADKPFMYEIDAVNHELASGGL